MNLHVLYRFIAHDGALLYIGRSANPARRFAEHRSQKEWWSEVARISIERYADAAALAAAEARAIRTEAPRYNVALAASSRADAWWYAVASDADPSGGCSEWDAPDCPNRACGRPVRFLTCSGNYVCRHHASYYGAVAEVAV